MYPLIFENREDTFGKVHLSKLVRRQIKFLVRSIPLRRTTRVREPVSGTRRAVRENRIPWTKWGPGFARLVSVTVGNGSSSTGAADNFSPRWKSIRRVPRAISEKTRSLPRLLDSPARRINPTNRGVSRLERADARRAPSSLDVKANMRAATPRDAARPRSFDFLPVLIPFGRVTIPGLFIPATGTYIYICVYAYV